MKQIKGDSSYNYDEEKSKEEYYNNRDQRITEVEEFTTDEESLFDRLSNCFRPQLPI